MQVGHDYWTFKDGAPSDIMGLAQTDDGFLWLGGESGLFRFDGTRFEPFSSPFGDRLLSTNINDLFASPLGGLWVGYRRGGFSFVDKGRVTNYAIETGTVDRLTQDRNGVVWAGTSTGLWRFDHSGWQHIGTEWNVPSGIVAEAGFDAEGTLWALVGLFPDPKSMIYLPTGTRHFKIAANNLSTIHLTWGPDRTVLTAPVVPGMSGFNKGSDESLPVYPITSSNLQMVDRNDSVWISPSDKLGILRLPKDSLSNGQNQAPAPDSETYDFKHNVNAEMVDREGNIWFGSTTGLHRFFYTPLIKQVFPYEAAENWNFSVAADDHGAVWISFETDINSVADRFYVQGGKAERRLPQVTASFIYRAPDNTFWFSGEHCLWHLVGKDLLRVDLPPEMVDQYLFMQTITADQQGGLWLSFGRHGLYRLANGSWTSYGGRNDLPRKGVICAFTDSLGRVWFGYQDSHLAVLDRDRVRVFGPDDDLQVGTITAIYGQGREIWIGGEFGLEMFDQGRFRKIAAVDDQWLRGISGIVETANGDLWLNTISGIFHIRKAEIANALKDSAYQVKGDHFGRREGLSGVADQVRPLPTAIEGTDGRLWFALNNGVVWLDPATYSEKRTVSPPITIQSISADDKFYAPDSRLSLPAHTSSLQISYTAVSLSNPEAIRFRYKLQEIDKNWHELAVASPVTYRDLPPGSYHFSVEASDTNGVWSGKPASMAFTILPAFYQTVWFRGLCVLAVLLLLWAGYTVRVRQLQEQEQKFRDAVETMPALAFVTDPKGNPTFLNRGWLEYTGLSSEQALGSGWRAAIHPDDLKRVIERWSQSQTTGEPLDYEARLRRGSDGVYRWFQTRAQPLRDSRGKIVKWCGVSNDIEDRKRTEHLRADLTHASRVSTMGELVASISHELAQPITVTTAHAKASLRWLQGDPPDLTEVRKGTERIIEAGTLASEIINRLRSLYKKSSPKRELVAINEVIGEMARMLKTEARRRGVSIRTDLKDGLPMTVADRVQIQQVLMNLMLNGIEAITDAGGMVTVKSQLGTDGQIEISVHDTGSGLPLNNADQIFEAFFTTKPQGSGMGLAISKSIVDSHGGRIWVKGGDGRGVAFHFTLSATSAETNPS